MITAITTDKEKATFQAEHEFEADLPLVWRAWTEPNLLDQWWAPKPWKCETLEMDFKPGGKWIYEMVGPNGERHRGIQIFDEIEENYYFSGKDAFLDDEGNINEELPVANWKNTFTPTGNGTLVVSSARYPDTLALETVLKMGMAEGFSKAQENLDEVLAEMK